MGGQWTGGLGTWSASMGAASRSGSAVGQAAWMRRVVVQGKSGRICRQPGRKAAGQPRAAAGSHGQPVSLSAAVSRGQPRAAAGSRGQPRSAGPVLWSQPAQARLSREESLVESEGHAKAKIILVAISKRDPVDPVGLGSRAIGAGGQGSGGRDSSKLRPRRHRSRTDRLQNLLSTLGGGAYG